MVPSSQDTCRVLLRALDDSFGFTARVFPEGGRGARPSLRRPASVRSKPHGDMVLGEELLDLPDRELAEVENAGGEHGVGFALQQDRRHVFE